MCLLAVAPRKAAIPHDHLVNAYDHNSDGFGIMYAKGGRVVWEKKLAGFSEFAPMWDRVPENKSVAVHFRFGTSGGKSDDTCHPFAVLTMEEHGRDLYLMHNGVLSHPFRGEAKKSDTMQFVEMLRTLLVKDPDALRNPALVALLERDIGSNKMVLLEGNGRWHYLNKEEGKTHKSGVWYSNEYSLCTVYSGHGKGKAAIDGDWDSGDYGNLKGYSSTGYWLNEKHYNYGTSTSADYTQADWFMESGTPTIWWKPQSKGYARMKRDAVTMKMVRDIGPGDYCKDFAALPAKAFRVTIKDVTKFMAGTAPLVHSIVRGESVVDATGPGTALVTVKDGMQEACERAGLPARDQVTSRCPNSNATCDEQCNYLCKKATREAADKPVVTFQKSQDAADHEGPSIPSQAGLLTNSQRADLFARHAETIDEAKAYDNAMRAAELMEAAERDREQEIEAGEEAYRRQLWSEPMLRQLSEQEMVEQIEDDPESAAIALGYALGMAWAYQEEDVA